MSIMKILNPWRALRDAEAALRDAEARIRHAEILAHDANERQQRFSLLAIGRAHEISRMQKLLKHCHFRDPATGRIGPKGEMPK